MDVATAERRLRHDFPFFAAKCLRIVDQRAQTVSLKLKRAQQEVDRRLEAQAADGRPMRAVILKARKLGMSTMIEGKITHRYTQMENHRAVVVAHDKKTAGELFDMSETMYAKLPNRTVGKLQIKPAIVASRRRTEIKLGEESRSARQAGELGINSSLVVDTAGEIQAGRGFTYHSLHLSEVAFWPDAAKMTALLNSVPDEPNTMVVLESTANGHNFFRRIWRQAEEGLNDYEAIFFPWFEDPYYVRPFLNDEERSRFESTIGEGEFGEAEPGLQEMGITLEQLNWRRWAIANRTSGDLRNFQQEYPQTPEEAFLATGRQVFSMVLVSKVISRAEKLTPDEGLIVADADTITKREVRGQTYSVPSAALWKPRETIDISPVGQAWWRLWAKPDVGNWEGPNFDPRAERKQPGQYIVGVDPASGEETDSGELAYHAVEVIDHRTLEQVAEYRSRNVDPDQVMLEALHAALYYNGAWIAVEKTGGYGLSILNALVRIYRYPRVYRRRAPDIRTEKQSMRLGWDTNERTKRQLIDYAKKLLREGVDGVRSTVLAGEMATFVRDELGRTGPDTDAFADALMAWMIAQQVGNEIPLRTFEHARREPPRRVLSKVAGY